MQRDTDELNSLELDRMLRSLKDAPIPAPADEIRHNLQRVTAISLVTTAPRSHSATSPSWIRWAFATTACAAAIAGVGLHHTLRPHQNVTGIASVVDRSGAHATQVVAPNVQQHVHSSHGPTVGVRKSVIHPKQQGSSRPRSFTVELPYSNRDIANGTDAEISVQVSREELLALGYPIGDVTGDHKYLAEIALGDDGLPRSIRIPLPLRSID